MTEYVRVAPLSGLKGSGGNLVHIRGLDIAIFRCGGEFVALNNVCSHQHFSMLHKGLVEDCTVTCPMHGWVYDLRTGKALTGDGRVSRYAVREEGGDLLIELPAEPV
jgi:nitrite reductase/ring-hydroxylating ferredoxin subunit